MRWRTGRRSSNVEDRRRQHMGTPGRLPMRGGGLGMIVLILAAAYFGIDPSIILNQSFQGGGTQPVSEREPTPEENQLADFISVVLALPITMGLVGKDAPQVLLMLGFGLD